MYSIPDDEKLITIWWDTKDRVATVDVSDPEIIRELDEMVKNYPREYRSIFEDVLYEYKRYQVESEYIRFVEPESEA